MSRNPSKIKRGRFCSVCVGGGGSQSLHFWGTVPCERPSRIQAHLRTRCSGRWRRTISADTPVLALFPVSCQKQIVPPTLRGDCRFGDQTFGTGFLEQVCCVRSIFLPRSFLQTESRQKTTVNVEMSLKNFSSKVQITFYQFPKLLKRQKLLDRNLIQRS